MIIKLKNKVIVVLFFELKNIFSVLKRVFADSEENTQISKNPKMCVSLPKNRTKLTLIYVSGENLHSAVD